MPLHWKFCFRGSRGVSLVDLLTPDGRALNPKLQDTAMAEDEARQLLSRSGGRLGRGDGADWDAGVAALLRSEVRPRGQCCSTLTCGVESRWCVRAPVNCFDSVTAGSGAQLFTAISCSSLEQELCCSAPRRQAPPCKSAWL